MAKKGLISYRELLGIAAPIALGNLAQTLITLTDTAFLGRISENALSASLITGIYYFVFITLAWGFGVGVQIMIARRLGEEKFERIGVIFQHGLYFMVPLALALFALLSGCTEFFLRMSIQSDEIFRLAMEYMEWRQWGILFVCFNFLFRSLYIGLSDTKPISYSTGMMAAINILLDYLLVFGAHGFPELGIAGAAIASVCAEISALIFFVVYSFKRLPIKKYSLFAWHRIEGWLMRRILGLALPTMVQRLFSIGLWYLFFIFIEHMGERPIAVAGVVRSVYMLISIATFAFGVTTNTVISRYIGQGEGHLIWDIMRRIATLSFSFLLPLIVLIWMAPNALLSIYTDNYELMAASHTTIRTLAIHVGLQCFAIIIFEAVSGVGETLAAMWMELLILVPYTIQTWLFASVWQLPIEWVWSSEITYWVLLGILSYFYLVRKQRLGFRKL